MIGITVNSFGGELFKVNICSLPQDVRFSLTILQEYIRDIMKTNLLQNSEEKLKKTVGELEQTKRKNISLSNSRNFNVTYRPHIISWRFCVKIFSPDGVRRCNLKRYR